MSHPPPSPPQPSIFTPYLSPSLQSHLTHLPTSTPLDSLSRTTPSRLRTTALPNIGLIELVSSTDFDVLYDALYKASFPRRTERERSDLIVERLAAQAQGARTGLAPYRIVGIRDHKGEAIGAAQFSVLPVPPTRMQQQRRRQLETATGRTRRVIADAEDEDDGGDGGKDATTFKYAVPYLQYIYVRAQNRRQDMSEVLHTMVLAVASADAALMDTEADSDAQRHGTEDVDTTTSSSAGKHSVLRTVPFTLFETEPPDHGDDHASRAYALERSKIHTSSGGVALVLRRPRAAARPGHQEEEEEEKEKEEDEILSVHVQPGLEPDDPPLTLVWMIRPSPTSDSHHSLVTTRLGKALVAAYYQSLRDEGFPEKNIRLAERIVAARCRGSSFDVMPLSEVRDFTMEPVDGYVEVE